MNSITEDVFLLISYSVDGCIYSDGLYLSEINVSSPFIDGITEIAIIKQSTPIVKLKGTQAINYLIKKLRF